MRTEEDEEAEEEEEEEAEEEWRVPAVADHRSLPPPVRDSLE